jgi:hypothetical protein
MGKELEIALAARSQPSLVTVHKKIVLLDAATLQTGLQDLRVLPLRGSAQSKLGGSLAPEIILEGYRCIYMCISYQWTVRDRRAKVYSSGSPSPRVGNLW